MKVNINETSGITFVSYDWKSTTEHLISSGWLIMKEQLEALENNEDITIWDFRRLRKLLIKKR